MIKCIKLQIAATVKKKLTISSTMNQRGYFSWKIQRVYCREKKFQSSESKLLKGRGKVAASPTTEMQKN